MLNIKLYCHTNKGFTLIEIIISLFISSIIVLSIMNILQVSIKACNYGENKDQLLLNGRYAIQYIKDDIKSADKIIDSNKIENLISKFPTNIGFVILKHQEVQGTDLYITYHRKDDKIVRTACEFYGERYPTAYYFSGYNDLCETVEDINNTKSDWENSIINLELKFKYKDSQRLELKSQVFIRCPIDY